MQIKEVFKIFLPGFITRQLEGRKKLQKIIANICWMFFDKVLRISMSLFVGVWVARYLGPERFGTLNYAIAFTALFGAFAGLGLDNIIIRDIVKESFHKDEILGTGFVLKLTGGIVSLVLSISVISFVKTDDILIKWLVGIVAVGFVFQAFDGIDFWFQSQVQAKYTVYAKNSAFLMIAIVKIVLIKMQAPLIMFAWAGLAEIILGAMGLLITYRINGQHLKAWKTNLLCAKELLKDSWPLALSSISIMLYMKIDQVMLGEMLGNEAVGIYSAAVRVSELWYFIPMAIVVSVTPSIIEAKKINEVLYYQKLQKTFNIMALIAYSIAIPMTFLSKPLVLLLYGQNFSAAGGILAIHIWSALFVFLGVVQGTWDATENLTKFAFFRTSLGALINILLNFILIPLYSGVGAAIATVISYALSAYFFNTFIYKTRPIFRCQTKSLLLGVLYEKFI